MNDVTILLATYNGEAFLEEQLESLFSQEGWSGKILARDDGSTDRTVEILQKFPDRIEILPSSGNLGVVGNFSKLMENCNSPYMMFCDQDDVWKKDKIKVTYKAMKRLEQEQGSDIPLLVHTDLEVVDEELRLIAPSYWKYVKLSSNPTFSKLLMQNSVTGCTVLMNQKLAEIAKPIPQEAFMHDWWIALVAKAFGKVDFLQQATVRYRQHMANEIGASSFSLMRKGTQLLKCGFKKQLQKSVALAKVLNDLLKSDLEAKKITEALIRSCDEGFLRSRWSMVTNGLVWQGFWRNLAFLSPQ